MATSAAAREPGVARAGAGRGLGPTPIHALVLSPHFDDAAFSCGGTIRRLTAAGRRVVVVTVCAAPPRGPLSPFAASLHRRWGAAPGTEQASAQAVVAERRAEDAAAMGILGAETVYLGVPDCIYRTAPDGDWLYRGEAAIFGPVSPGDRATATHIATALAALPGLHGRSRVLAPLAVGHHVDHQLVRQAAEAVFAGRALRLRYHEDYPYAEDAGALAAALVGTADGDAARAAISGAPSATGHGAGAGAAGGDAAPAMSPGRPAGDPVWLGAAGGWRPHLARLGADHLAAKLAAAARYRSQLNTFWRDEPDQARALSAFALRRGQGRWPAERLWERVRAGHDTGSG